MKNFSLITSYKDDSSKVAELKQQMSQKMKLLRNTLTVVLVSAAD